MKGGEPSVLQPPPEITKGGHPPWTPLYITLLIYVFSCIGYAYQLKKRPWIPPNFVWHYELVRVLTKTIMVFGTRIELKIGKRFACFSNVGVRILQQYVENRTVQMRTTTKAYDERWMEGQLCDLTSLTPRVLSIIIMIYYCLMIQTITKSAIYLNKVPLLRSISCHPITGSAGS